MYPTLPANIIFTISKLPNVFTFENLCYWFQLILTCIQFRYVSSKSVCVISEFQTFFSYVEKRKKEIVFHFVSIQKNSSRKVGIQAELCSYSNIILFYRYKKKDDGFHWFLLFFVLLVTICLGPPKYIGLETDWKVINTGYCVERFFTIEFEIIGPEINDVSFSWKRYY